MKNVLFSLALSSTLLSTATVAQEQPYQIDYKCSAGGCSLICKDERSGKWETVANNGNSVRSFNYPNGNMEFYFDRGAKGDERVIIGQDKLQCKVVGAKS
ncbi:hypothetical protein WLQ65_05905 [Pseudoalteromonas piscicida]|uniref:hypothetical protein n=1 Tax=Pseudoalteromonas piscicida TaxID=43662 RepID=UPI0030C9D899